MKRFYTILSALLLVMLLVVGFYTLLSPAQEGAPKLSLKSLISGKYAADYRSYYAESFPESEGLKGTNVSLNGFYKFSALSGEGDVSLIIDMNSGAADHGEALQTTTSSIAPEPSEPGETTEPTTEPEETIPEVTGNLDDTEDNGVVENLGAVMLVGNRAIEVPYASYDIIEEYAAAVTAIADALGSDIRTFNIAVPNAAEFYAPEDFHTGSSSQIDMIDYCYDNLGDSVISVDAYSKLADHTDEYIYFRTDHHWTQLGAYYAYQAYCEEAGLEIQSLDKFETGQRDNFLGSLYWYIDEYPQSSVLKENPDICYFYRPFVELNTRFYMDATLSMAYETGTICYVDEDTSNKYLTFIGGDHPVTIIETDVDNDEVVLLLKESYGNAFAPWLTSHYSKVVVVDPREFNRDGKPSMDLVEFAESQGVTDCIILNYPMMLNSTYYATWLARMVE